MIFTLPLNNAISCCYGCKGTSITREHVLTIVMFSTPTKLFIMPLYAGGLAQFFVEVPSLVLLCSQPINARILAFFNVEAKHDNSDGISSPSL